MCPKKEKATDYQWLLSGWQDSNLRPPHPKCGAIPGYATPRKGITFVDCDANIQRFIYLSRLFLHFYNNQLIYCQIAFSKHLNNKSQKIGTLYAMKNNIYSLPLHSPYK